MMRLYYKVKIKPTSINCVLRFFLCPEICFVRFSICFVTLAHICLIATFASRFC